MTSSKDRTIDYLLELHGIRYVIDDSLGFWVKFEAQQVDPTSDRPHGIKYSLSLHDSTNKTIMKFDNSHAIEHGHKHYVSPERVFDHWHRDHSDKGRPYHYENAAKLLKDF